MCCPGDHALHRNAWSGIEKDKLEVLNALPQLVAIASLQCGTGQDDRIRLVRHYATQQLEPGFAVGIAKSDAVAHFLAATHQMMLVSFNETCIKQARQRLSERRFSRARYAHHNDFMLHIMDSFASRLMKLTASTETRNAYPPMRSRHGALRTPV